MKTWKDWLQEEQKDKHIAGTYVSAKLSEQSTKELYEWVKDNNINNPINPHLKDNDYHVTVVYSRKGIEKAKGEDIGLPLTAKIVDWEIFNAKNGNKCLVGKIDSETLVKAHNMFREKYGATHDFESYIPHLTVSYDYGDSEKPTTVPEFNLTFDSKEFKALDPSYLPSNNKDK